MSVACARNSLSRECWQIRANSHSTETAQLPYAPVSVYFLDMPSSGACGAVVCSKCCVQKVDPTDVLSLYLYFLRQSFGLIIFKCDPPELMICQVRFVDLEEKARICNACRNRRYPYRETYRTQMDPTTKVRTRGRETLQEELLPICWKSKPAL